MLNVIEGLDRDIFEPAVCGSKRGGALDRKVEQIGIPFLEEDFTVPIKPYRSLLWRAWKAARRFRHYGFHLWHSYHYL